MSPGNEERRPRATDGVKDLRSSTSLPAFPEEVVDELPQLVVRLLEDCIAAGRPAVWLRRAQAFEDARPKPGDFNGQATPEEVAERDARLAETAERCRVHARFLTENPPPLAAYERDLIAGIIGGDPR